MTRIAKRIAGRTLERPVATVFVVAIVIRLLLAASVALLSDGSLFQDDRGYIRLAVQHANGSSTWDSVNQTLWNINSSFLAPIGVLFKVVGPYPLLAQSISALAGSVTAACVTALVSYHTRQSVALGAGLTAAVYPSQVLWSSLVLKDALVWMSLALLALVMAWWQQSGNHRRYLVGLGYLTAILLYLSNLRAHTLLVACIALTVATIWSSRSLRAARSIATLVLLLVVPATAGIGIGGNQILQIGLSGMEEQRQAGAINAATALVDIQSQAEPEAEAEPTEEAEPEAEAEPTEEAEPEAEAEPTEEAEPEADVQLNLATEPTPTITDDLLYLPSGLRSMLLDPLPPQLARSSKLRLAFAEHLVWYPALLLAIVGLSAVRGRSPELVFTVLVGVGLVTMWALVEGNFGTAFRHRGEIVWAVLLLAGIGAERLLHSKLATRYLPATKPPPRQSPTVTCGSTASFTGPPPPRRRTRLYLDSRVQRP